VPSTLGFGKSKTLTAAAADERTDRFEPIVRPDDSFRHEGGIAEPVLPGRYIQVHAPDQRLIRLGDGVVHIGRGLAANLRLDDSSVSRRHAVLISRPSGHRILDDRSLNGTFVNSMRIEQYDLRNGDLIAIGRVMLLFLNV
jgi:FHA domain